MVSYITFTDLARSGLLKRQNESAISNFKGALQDAEKGSDASTISMCQFNLGAAYIALKKPDDGIEILKRIKIVDGDWMLKADKQYNMGLACELKKDIALALKWFKKSYSCYQHSDLDPDRHSQKAAITCKIANIYAEMRDYGHSAEFFQAAAAEYRAIDDDKQQIACLYQKALMLKLAGNLTGAVSAAKECELCTASNDTSSHALNEIGMFFNECKEHNEALKCFQKLLSVVELRGNFKELEATLQQNIGAVFICLEQYQRAIDANQRAAVLFAQLKMRIDQGNCFRNIAFAYSQLSDFEKAKEFYLHALQAARDSDNKSGEWQALEGLCGVSFHHQQYERCREYLIEAITASSDMLDNKVDKTADQRRLINKLTHVIQVQLSGCPPHGGKTSQYAAGHPPPSTASRDLMSKDGIHNKSARGHGYSYARSVSAEGQLELMRPIEPDQHEPLYSQVNNRILSDTATERMLQKEAYRQELKRSNKENNENSDDDDEHYDGNDKDDEDDDSDDSDDSDDGDDDDDSEHDDSHCQRSSSAPMYTAPHAPRNGTYLNPRPSGQLKIVKYSEQSEQDPTYMTIRVNGEDPPPLPPRSADASKRESRDDDTSRSGVTQILPRVKPKAKPAAQDSSSACALM